MMSLAGKTIQIFGIYLWVIGTILLVIPNLLLSILAVPNTEEFWVRIVGMLAILLGYYYWQSAQEEVRAFFQWTVYARATVIVFFVGFAVLRLAPPILMLFGFIDLAGAIWTEWALRKEK